MRFVGVVAGLIAAASVASPCAAALPVGTEFQVNSFTINDQLTVSLATDSAGDFVVVWSSNGQDGANSGIFGQRFSAAGAPSGGEFQVNTVTLGSQLASAVSAAPDGAHVVTWTSPDGGLNGIFGQRYDNAGLPVGGEFQVNSYTSGDQVAPAIASGAGGDFVVAWTDRAGRDGSAYGVFARRFDSTGSALGDDFQVNAYTAGRQGDPRLAIDASGNWVAVWDSQFLNVTFDPEIIGRRFDSAGGAIGTEFQVNTITVTGQDFPSVASDPNGNFVVTWRSFLDGSACSFQAQRFDSNATPLGIEFQVNTQTFLCQAGFRQAVSVDASGRFAIVWEDQSLFADGSVFAVSGQHYDSAGAPIGTEFRVNSYTVYAQRSAVVSAAASGDFVVAWTSYEQDGSLFGVFAQRYDPAAPPTSTTTPTPTETPTATPTFPPTDSPTITPTATPVGACPPSVDGGCTAGFEKALLSIKEDAGREKLIAKLIKGPQLAQTDLGNPLEPGGTVYSLCIYDDAGSLAGGSVVVDRAGDICTGYACWKAIGADPPSGKGYKYKDGTLAADGVLKLLYKGGDAGKSKAIVKGKGPNLPDGIAAALQTSAFATVQLRSSDGICLSVVVDEITAQSAGTFKAKFASP